MLEKHFENVLHRYPELIEEGLKFSGRQVSVGGKYVDLLFEDRFGQKLIVELKKENIRDISEKKYLMGGQVRVDIYDTNNADKIDVAFELAKRSFYSDKSFETGLRKRLKSFSGPFGQDNNPLGLRW